MAEFYIASLKHTSRDDEFITWWGGDWRGYTPVAGEKIGRYDEENAAILNNGVDTIAIPVEAMAELLSEEPYYQMRDGRIHRWFDQRGPVVENTRENWNRIIGAARPGGFTHKPKPEIYRRKRRSGTQASFQPAEASA